MGEFEDKLNAILGNQEAMGQIMALAQSLGGGAQQQPPAQPAREDGYVPVASEEPGTPALPAPASAGGDPVSMLGGLDPRLMQLGMHLLQEYNRSDDRNAALLAALRPFVREERYAKVDRAVQIARLSRVVRVLLEMLKENGGAFHV